MKLSSYQGEYNRIVKHVKALTRPHSFTDSEKAACLSSRISELRRVMRVLESLCPSEGESYAPAPPSWKPPVTSAKHDARTSISLFNRAKTFLSRMFNRGTK
jgi:hypothetical protein